MAKGTSFYGKSDEHAGINVGDKFRLSKTTTRFMEIYQKVVSQF